MKITSFIPADNIQGRKHRKENGFVRSLKLITYDPMDGFKTVLDVRFYSTKATSFCCIWLNHKQIYASGSASYSAYGMHISSCSFENALKSMGIELDESIGGCGDGDINLAIKLIAEHLELEAYTIIESHA